MIRRWWHRLLRRPGVQRHTVDYPGWNGVSEYEAEQRQILDDYYCQDRTSEREPDLCDCVTAALDPDGLPDVNLTWDRADEIAVERDYSTYRYDYRLPGERVL